MAIPSTTSLNKTALRNYLRTIGYPSFEVNSKTLCVVTDTPFDALSLIHKSLPSSEVVKNSYVSVYGAVRVHGIDIVATKPKLKFKPMGMVGGATPPGVVNRLKFAHLVHQALAQAPKPMTLVVMGGTKLTLKGITKTRFLGDGVADFRLMEGTKAIPVTVNADKGTYRIDLQGRAVHDMMHDALVEAVEAGKLFASMQGDRMTLDAPVAVPAPLSVVREYLLQDIKGGFGVIGDFDVGSARYDGKINTLFIQTEKVFRSGSDLMSRKYRPYIMVNNDPRGKIADLEGLRVDLVPMSALPRDTTFINT